MKKILASAIKKTLDKWVSGVGTGRYQPGNLVDNFDKSFSITENFGIQQVKTEIYKFIDVLLKQKKIKNCLEIGLGAYGSTHFLWRLMFNKTITIEHQKHRVHRFMENMNKFHKKFVLNDLKSRFIFGSSHDTSSVEKVDKILESEKLMEGLEHWYDNYYFTYGIQKIRNIKDNDIKLKRRVFYINKIQLNN